MTYKKFEETRLKNLSKLYYMVFVLLSQILTLHPPPPFSSPHSPGYFGLLEIIVVRLIFFFLLQVNLMSSELGYSHVRVRGNGYFLIVKGIVTLFSSRITYPFYSWWKLWSVVFHCMDSALHGTQSAPWELGITVYWCFCLNPKSRLTSLCFQLMLEELVLLLAM